MSAIMRLTIFCSLFILTNFLRRRMTSLEIFLVLAVPLSFIQGCSSTESTLALTLGSSLSIMSTHSLAPSEMSGQGLKPKFSSPSLYRITLCKISLSHDPKKGGDPHSKMYRMTPVDHKSASLP